MRYDTILFDADETLFDFKRCEHDAIYEVLLETGITPDEQIIEEYSRINDSLWKMLERGETDKKSLRLCRFEMLCERFGFNAEPQKLSELYVDALATKNYLLGNALEVCEHLSQKCRMYIVTNGIERVQTERFAASPINKYFGGLFVSEKIGFEKPRAEYFNAVARQIEHFDKNRTLIVGDSLTSDIKGGIAAGIDTCWFNPSKKEIPTDMKIDYIISDLSEIERIVE